VQVDGTPNAESDAQPDTRNSEPGTRNSERRGCFSDICSDMRSCGGRGIWNRIVVFFFRTDFQLLALYRIAHYAAAKKFPGRTLIGVITRHLQQRWAASEIAPGAQLGRNTRFAHPVGVVIGDQAVVEDEVTIFQGVTLGSHGRSEEGKSYPTIKRGATLYAGVKVIGGVTVGEGAVVGANAVVTSDVPDGAVAVGIPAKVVQDG
jgi:serine O-acetyltransferase